MVVDRNNRYSNQWCLSL